MQNRMGRTLQHSTSGQNGDGGPSGFHAAFGVVMDRSTVATAVTEGERHLLRYVNPAFLELAGGADDPGLGRPLAEQFPQLADVAAHGLLDLVHETGQAVTGHHAQCYSHPSRGTVFLTLIAWPCDSAGTPAMSVIQYLETGSRAYRHDRVDERTQALRDINERLLVTGVREHDLAQETARRLAVAQKAAEQSESALQTHALQTQNLARRLITAQEAERTCLARELHDDVSQQLAGLAIALSVLRRRLPENLDVALSDVDRLQQRTSLLIETIRALSHELHPGTLRSTGLLSALRHLCAEIRQHTDTAFRAVGEPDDVPSDVSLTLYRVAQEALHNVTRHAGARHADVLVTRDGEGIQLQITDDGRGFVNRDDRRGLGLMSMEERVLVVNGNLTIDSLPGFGTRVCVRIPAASLTPRDERATVPPG